MNPLKKVHKIVGQNDHKVNTSHKHDVNVQKNATLYFQVGMILALMVTYALFEMQFETQSLAIEEVTPPLEDELYAFNDVIIIEEDKKTEPLTEKKKMLIDNPVVVPDDHPTKAIAEKIITEVPTNGPDLKIEDVKVIDEPEVHNIINVEQVPIFPGCQDLKTNKERRACLSSKINALVSKRFDVDRVSDNGISGRHRINVQFTINTDGEIVDEKFRSPHKVLDEEAQKVIDKMPKMIPAKQGNKNVSVIFTLPIIIQIQD